MITTWDDNLSIGVEKIDQQHQDLFTKASSLIQKCKEGTTEEKNSATKKLISFLINYFSNHFKTEERIQKLINYPNYKYHKKAHESFKNKIENIKIDFQQNNKPLKTTISLNHQLLKLFTQHIRSEDKEIGNYIKYIRNEEWKKIDNLTTKAEEKKKVEL